MVQLHKKAELKYALTMYGVPFVISCTMIPMHQLFVISSVATLKKVLKVLLTCIVFDTNISDGVYTQGQFHLMEQSLAVGLDQYFCLN